MAKISDEEFMELIEAHGPTGAAKVSGLSLRWIFSRRRAIEAKLGVTINAAALSPDDVQKIKAGRKARLHRKLKDGVVVVFSDAHYWPQLISTAHAALLEVIKEIAPSLVVANGDIFDGASQSRHTRINWEEVPGTAPELYACQSRLAEIELAAPKAERVWTLGNHDARFESYIANNAPELAKVHGVHLKDHFSEWEPAWSLWINDDVVIKHRWKGGVNAARNNTLNSGKHIVTGHTHQMNCAPHTDYNGTRFGIECGTLAEPFGPQFEAYTEDNPRNWVSGFVVLTFKNGELLWPEYCRTAGQGMYEFRGSIREIGSDKKRKK